MTFKRKSSRKKNYFRNQCAGSNGSQIAPDNELTFNNIEYFPLIKHMFGSNLQEDTIKINAVKNVKQMFRNIIVSPKNFRDLNYFFNPRFHTPPFHTAALQRYDSMVHTLLNNKNIISLNPFMFICNILSRPQQSHWDMGKLEWTLLSKYFDLSIGDRIETNKDILKEIIHTNLQQGTYDNNLITNGYSILDDILYEGASVNNNYRLFGNWVGNIQVIDQNVIRQAYTSGLQLTDGDVNVIIPDSVTSIEALSFKDCSWFVSVTLPDSVISIGSGAFWGCISLTSVSIPDSVISIVAGAFYGCTSLTGVDIPSSVTRIEGHTFGGCSSLASVVIPDSVISIGASAFYGCTSLTDVTLPDSVISIGESAFAHCTSLASVVIPQSVTSIERRAFEDCRSLASVDIPDSVNSIEDDVFLLCISLAYVSIPDSVLSIGSRAFRRCFSLASVHIPASVTSIGKGAFSDCSSLTDVIIPDSVTSIGYDAFRLCSSLTSVAIPSSVTRIEGNTFAGCTSLKYIVMSPVLKGILMQNNIDIGVENNIIYDFDYDLRAPNNSNYFNIPDDPFFGPNQSPSNNSVSNGGSRKKLGNIKRKKNIKSKRKIR